MTTTRGEDESQEPDRAGSEAIRELLRRKPDFVFTRADAIAEGELIDVSQVAREEGITVPDSIAITDNAWDAVVGSRGAAAGPGETYRWRRWFRILRNLLADE